MPHKRFACTKIFRGNLYGAFLASILEALSTIINDSVARTSHFDVVNVCLLLAFHNKGHCLGNYGITAFILKYDVRLELSDVLGLRGVRSSCPKRQGHGVISHLHFAHLRPCGVSVRFWPRSSAERTVY